MGDRYRFSFSGCVVLSAEDIWPDGVPESHSESDVRTLIEDHINVVDWAREWNMDDDVKVDVVKITPHPRGQR